MFLEAPDADVPTPSTTLPNVRGYTGGRRRSSHRTVCWRAPPREGKRGSGSVVSSCDDPGDGSAESLGTWCDEVVEVECVRLSPPASRRLSVNLSSAPPVGRVSFRCAHDGGRRGSALARAKGLNMAPSAPPNPSPPPAARTRSRSHLGDDGTGVTPGSSAPASPRQSPSCSPRAPPRTLQHLPVPPMVALHADDLGDVLWDDRDRRWRGGARRWPFIIDSTPNTASAAFRRRLGAAVVAADDPLCLEKTALRSTILCALRYGRTLLIDVGGAGIAAVREAFDALAPGLWQQVMSRNILKGLAELLKAEAEEGGATVPSLLDFGRASQFCVVLASASMADAMGPGVAGHVAVYLVEADNKRAQARPQLPSGRPGGGFSPRWRLTNNTAASATTATPSLSPRGRLNAALAAAE